MPWAQFAHQWGGANINEHRREMLEDIDGELVEGEVDEDATIETVKRGRQDKNGNVLHSTIQRLGSNWGIVSRDGHNYEVSEKDAFTFKEIPGIQRLAPGGPRGRPPPSSPRRPPPSPDIRFNRAGDVDFDFADLDAIEDEPVEEPVARGRAPSVGRARAPPVRRARQFQDASPARAPAGPRRSSRPRAPRARSNAFGGLPTGKGWSPEQNDWVGCGGYTSSDWLY